MPSTASPSRSVQTVTSGCCSPERSSANTVPGGEAAVHAGEMDGEQVARGAT